MAAYSELTTGLGMKMDVSWMGISSIDGGLRFSVIDNDLRKLFDIFTNPDHTRRITRTYTEWPETTRPDETVYEGFVIFEGLYRDMDGNTTIRLAKK